MTRSIFILFFFALSFSSCQEEEPAKPEETTTQEQLSTRSIVHDGTQREYVIFIPVSYDGIAEVPLMFNFHGFGGTASGHMQDADMRSLAESETFILVYPQGTEIGGSSHWNPSLPSDDNKSDADDLGFIETLINALASEYSIDTKRVYACGYSNGGMMSYGLANYKSELIAAVGSVSGAMLDLGTSAPTSHPMPVIHLHGTNDGVIPYAGNTYYNSAQSVVDYWVGFNNTSTSPTQNTETSGSVTIEYSLYDQGDNGASVELYKYVNEDHVWFSNTYQGKSTAQLIWDFVSRYDLDGLR